MTPPEGEQLISKNSSKSLAIYLRICAHLWTQPGHDPSHCKVYGQWYGCNDLEWGRVGLQTEKKKKLFLKEDGGDAKN